MKNLRIQHAQGSYEVEFGSIDDAWSSLPESRIVITDENVWAAWGSRTPSDRVLVLPPGEHTKSLEWFERCLRWMAGAGADRKTTVVALGGGVIGDLVGFVASSYMRGVPYVQVPTTLLAQVDSSVGGKVAVDLPEGKNLVGAFYAPRVVHICAETLGTLPSRQFVNGMAEVWKYGFIMDSALVDRLDRHELSPTCPETAEIVRRCIALKAEVVEQDEFETLGVRAILNFGHTVGHAIEAITQYGPLLHGEAISIGMAVEARLGERLGICVPGVSGRVLAALEKQGLPTRHSALERRDELVAAMRRDKKARSGSLAFSLLTDMGKCRLVENVDEADVRAAMQES